MIYMSLLYFIFQTVLANSDLTESTQELISLRSQVEKRAETLERNKKNQDLEIEALLQRKNEINQAISRERLKSEINLAKKDGLKPQPKKNKEVDLKFVSKWIQDLKEMISSSLPYKQEERILSLKNIETQIQEGKPLESLVQDLWKLTENELRLTQTNQFEIMKILLNGQRTTAQVAKIGMLQMYFKTADSVVGRADKGQSGWKLLVAQEAKEVAAIERALEKIKNEKGSAFIELPGVSKGSDL